MNIINLLQADGFQPEHASGDEWHAPCFVCGGRDRLSIRPNERNTGGAYLGGRYVCRQCGVYGDAAGYLMKRRGLRYPEACRAIGIELQAAPGAQTGRHSWEPKQAAAEPDENWRNRARAFLEYSQRALWKNPDALQWLQSERGLNPESIKAAGLGWNPAEVFHARRSWGMQEEKNPRTGRPKKVWLPRGLVIPFVRDDRIIRLRIRRPDTQKDKYIPCSGSSMAPMNLWGDQSAVAVCESELDALLLMQECGDLVGTVALGSCQAKPDSRLHDRLVQAETVLCCLDNDAAGRQASKFWARYPGYRLHMPAGGKDAGEMFHNGHDVRAWIERGLK